MDVAHSVSDSIKDTHHHWSEMASNEAAGDVRDMLETDEDQTEEEGQDELLVPEDYMRMIAYIMVQRLMLVVIRKGRLLTACIRQQRELLWRVTRGQQRGLG